MQKHRLGLSPEEHRRAAGLLQRTASLLSGVLQMIRGRYRPDSAIAVELFDAAGSVRAARIGFEAAGRAEHPGAGMVYLTGDVQPAAESLANAFADSGEGIGEID